MADGFLAPPSCLLAVCAVNALAEFLLRRLVVRAMLAVMQLVGWKPTETNRQPKPRLDVEKGITKCPAGPSILRDTGISREQDLR